MKRPYPKVDFKDWNFEVNEALQPIAVQVAKVIWQQLCEDAFRFIHIDKENGPRLWVPWDDEEFDISLADFDLMRLTEDPTDEIDTMERDNLIAYHKGTLASIELFERWAAELRSDLPKIEAALERGRNEAS